MHGWTSWVEKGDSGGECVGQDRRRTTVVVTGLAGLYWLVLDGRGLCSCMQLVSKESYSIVLSIYLFFMY